MEEFHKVIPLFKVFIPQSVIKPLEDTLLSGFIGQGPKVEEFEKKLSEFLENSHLVTVNTGTSGIHLALRLIGIKSGDEVLTTPLTCTATNWPLVLAGANIKWVDVGLDTCNIDPEDIKRKISDKTKAIVVVHWGGYPCDIDKIKEIASNIPVIEDCAHAFGSEYNSHKVGTSGNYCMFSFQAIKHLTTIDGGCLVVPFFQLERARLLRWYGIPRNSKGRSDFRCELDVVEAGDKLHMNDVTATIGLEQMKHVESIIDRHRCNASFYSQVLQNLPGITLLENKQKSAYWLYTIRVEDRDGFMRYMKDKGIITSRVHERNDKHTCVREFRSDSLPNVDLLVQDMVCIPVGWWVTNEDREYIVDCIKRGW